MVGGETSNGADLRQEGVGGRGGDVEGPGCCAAGSWRGYRRQRLRSKAQVAAEGSCLCNNCSGLASEKVTEPVLALEQPPGLSSLPTVHNETEGVRKRCKILLKMRK